MSKRLFQYFSCLPSFSNQNNPALETNLTEPFLREETQSNIENTSIKYDKFTPIIVENWPTKCLEILLETENPNERIKNGHTPLSLAAELGREDMVKSLLKHGADPNMRAEFNNHTPLTLAAFSKHASVVKVLLENPNTEIDSATSNSSTPLTLATAQGATDVVLILLNKRADPDKAQSDNTTPLMVAAKSGDEGIATLLLDKKATIDAISKNSGYTALTEAASAGHEEVVNLLLASHANPNIITSITSPLIEALKKKFDNIAKTLLEHGADPTYLDNSALLYAIHKNRSVDLVKLLLKYGANPNKFEGTDLTPLMLAIILYSMPSFYALLNNEETEVNKAKTDGTTALMLAVEVQCLVMIRALAQHENIEIDKEKSDGTTALMLAAQSESVEIVKTLVEHGADVNKSSTSNSVIGFAYHNINKEIYHFLLPSWTNSFRGAQLKKRFFI